MQAVSTRTTVYFDPSLHKALKMKAVQMGKSISELLNEMLKINLLEDQEDLSAFEDRKDEKVMTYEDFLSKLKGDGIL